MRGINFKAGHQGGRGQNAKAFANASAPVRPAALSAQLSLLHARAEDALSTLAARGDAARDALEACLSTPCTARPMRAHVGSNAARIARHALCHRSRKRHHEALAGEQGHQQRWGCREPPAAGVKVLEPACCLVVKDLAAPS